MSEHPVVDQAALAAQDPEGRLYNEDLRPGQAAGAALEDVQPVLSLDE